MPQTDINYLAVLTAAIVNMVIGSLWYMPVLFGKQWMALSGVTMDAAKKSRNKAYLGMFIMALIMAYVLARFVDYTNAITASDGIVTALWLWIGFVMTIGAADVLFAGKPLRLFLINYGYHLVALCIMGALLAVWI